MTREHFFAHKEGIASNMRANLLFAKATGRIIQPYCAEKSIHNMVIYDDAERNERPVADILEDILAISREHNVPVKLSDFKEWGTCVHYHVGTQFTTTTPLIRKTITEEQIKDEMRKFVMKKLKLGDHATLECRVMELYKQGKIEWADVVEAHKGQCEL